MSIEHGPSPEEMGIKIEGGKNEKENSPQVFSVIKKEAEEIGYNIFTKTNINEEFKGYRRREQDDSRLYGEYPTNIPKETRKKFEELHLIPIDFMRLDKFGDTSIYISPSGLHSFKEKQELIRCSIDYQNNSSKFADHRAQSTTLTFFLEKQNINKLIDEVRKRPETLLDFINYIEPDLLKVAPKTKQAFYSGNSGIAIFQEDKVGARDSLHAEPSEILKWSDTVDIDKKVINKPEIIKPKQVVSEPKTQNPQEKAKSEAIPSKEKFIEEKLQVLLNGADLVGEIQYSPEKTSFSIKEKRGLFGKKFSVVEYWAGWRNKVIAESNNRDEMEKILNIKNKEKEEKIRVDLGRLWDKKFGRKV